MKQDVTHPAGSICHPSIRLHRGGGLRRYGTVPHAPSAEPRLSPGGTLAYVTSVSNVRDAIPFRRTTGNARYKAYYSRSRTNKRAPVDKGETVEPERCQSAGSKELEPAQA
jgi:hypothetical protein